MLDVLPHTAAASAGLLIRRSRQLSMGPTFFRIPQDRYLLSVKCSQNTLGKSDVKSVSFTHRTSTENLLDTSPSTSTGENMAVDPTPQKIVEEEDKVQMQDDIQTDSNVQLHFQNRNHLGPECLNDFGLWQSITILQDIFVVPLSGVSVVLKALECSNRVCFGIFSSLILSFSLVFILLIFNYYRSH
ncbi:hypothetical protein TNIN_165071 [Trichonephila inaurata madagascariensis]|uniref:Uncharacterized protein n=1 Tax=Trichonephila inaurata madagascariensis TaxID=2747483 RepID=A0A8X7CC71_9ARAC|nr:hypothetical protein TNIN_165071 [Trichonephila inaurata madagascariensis]